MRSAILLSLLPLSLLTSGNSAAQEASPLSLIPDDASVVIRLKAPDTTLTDLAAFVDKVQPGLGGMVQIQSSLLGTALHNPTLAGVDMSQDWYAAVFIDSQQERGAALLVPTTDSQALQDAVGEGFHFFKTDGWVAYAKKQALVERIENCAGGDLQSITKLLDEGSGVRLSSGHLTAVVNAGSLQKAFADELAGAEQNIDKLIDEMAEQVSRTSPGIDMQYVMDMYRDMGRLVVQGLRDATVGTISLSITEDDLQVEEFLTVKEGSQSDTFLQSHPVSDLARLQSVPDGLSGYWALSGNPETLFDWTERLLSGSVSDEAVKEKFSKSLEFMRKTKMGTVAGGGDLFPDEDAALRYFGVNEFTPAAPLRDAFLTFAPETEYEIAGIRQKLHIEKDFETVDGHSVDLYRFEQTIPPEMDPLGIQNAINERFYGPDGITQRLVLSENLFLNTIGGGTESIRKLLAPKEWSDETLLAARKRLPDTANLVMMADMPGLLHKFAKILLSSGKLPVPIRAEQLDTLQLSKSYAGFSLAAGPQQLHARTSLPVETFQGFAQIGMFVQQIMAGAR